MTEPIKMEQAMLDPTSVFACPDNVCHEATLTREQKIKILRRWEYDARELGVAEEENMGGGPPAILDQVLRALQHLDVDMNTEDGSRTKQGGE
jgi:hypothetical protein